MLKLLTLLSLSITSISFADNYYICSGDAALEIYEREQERQQKIRESFIKSYQERKEKKIKEMEKQVEETASKF